MGNMSYCRFANTYADLTDCARHTEDTLGGEEFRARKRLIELCREIAASYEGVNLDDHFEDADGEDEDE